MINEIKTDKELLVAVRNNVAGRIVENTANTAYWQYVVQHAPHDSQEIVNARKSVEANKDNVKKDTIFLRCIDLMLKNKK